MVQEYRPQEQSKGTDLHPKHAAGELIGVAVRRKGGCDEVPETRPLPI